MLKVIVELHPFGDANEKKEIASFDIANNMTGNVHNGNYDVRLMPTGRWHRNVVKEHDRTLPVLQLVREALNGLKVTGEI